MPDIYPMADVGVIPSIFNDPFNLTCIEFCANKIPVIISDHGAMKELVNDKCSFIAEYHETDFTDNIKNCMEKYADTAGCGQNLIPAVEESIDFLLTNAVDYEFRTTIVKELHTVQDISALAKRIQGAKRYFLQFFEDSGGLISDGLSPVDKQTMEFMKKESEKFIASVSVRGG